MYEDQKIGIMKTHESSPRISNIEKLTGILEKTVWELWDSPEGTSTEEEERGLRSVE